MQFFDFIISTLKNILIADIIDILFVSVFVYVILKFIRETRAEQFLKGLLFIVLLWQLTKLFELYAAHYILNSILEFGILAMIILFQPELRSMLERVGRKGFTKISFINSDENKEDIKSNDLINAIVDATTNLAITKTGALMVIERQTKLGEIVKTGTSLDADASSSLIMNLFYPKSPLHDGAVLFRNGRILAAGCILPLSSSKIASDLGTRHHAALGVSEISDAVVVVVSEETGIISVAIEGRLNRRITPDVLTPMLKKYLNTGEDKKKDIFSSIWKNKKNSD